MLSFRCRKYWWANRVVCILALMVEEALSEGALEKSASPAEGADVRVEKKRKDLKLMESLAEGAIQKKRLRGADLRRDAVAASGHIVSTPSSSLAEYQEASNVCFVKGVGAAYKKTDGDLALSADASQVGGKGTMIVVGGFPGTGQAFVAPPQDRRIVRADFLSRL